MIRAVTVNVGRHRPQRQRRAFWRVLHGILVRPSTTIGWQEIGEADGPVSEPWNLRRVFSAALGWKHIGVHLRTPITLNRLVWRVEHVSRVLAMQGIPKESPHRFIIAVRMRRRRGLPGDKHPLTRINTHFVRDPNGNARRRQGWGEHWRELVALVADEHEFGRDQLVSMDANRRRLPFELHPEAVIVWQRNLDYVIAIPAPGRKVETVHRDQLWIGIDGHRAGAADVRFSDA